MMRSYIGRTVDAFRFEEGHFLLIDSGEHNFVVPLDDASRQGPEAAHIVGVNNDGQIDPRQLWIW
jgi:hypothetical protein